MTVLWTTAFLDRPAATFDAAADFWMAVTDTTMSPVRGEHGQFATLAPADGDPYLRVQRVADGPGGHHLDLHGDDVGVTADRAVELGAKRVEDLEDLQILRSPAGLVFCVVRHRGESTRPAPVATGADRHRTIVDQLCIDIPPDHFDAECRFWSSLTQWDLRTSKIRPEFAVLVRPGGIPLRLLLQRLESAGDEIGCHLDIACDDREASAVDHESLGARIVDRYDRWILMEDPSGLPYCLTGRNPDTGTVD
ncbi:MAG: VOC family protein [Actinomycetota bacterium]|nr:VOC family protein [Actinomycetota bacterium]